MSFPELELLTVSRFSLSDRVDRWITERAGAFGAALAREDDTHLIVLDMCERDFEKDLGEPPPKGLFGLIVDYARVIQRCGGGGSMANKYTEFHAEQCNANATKN